MWNSGRGQFFCCAGCCLPLKPPHACVYPPWRSRAHRSSTLDAIERSELQVPGCRDLGGGGKFYTHTAYRQHGFKPIFNEICCQVQSKQLKRGVLGSWYRTKGTVGQDMLKVFMVKGICGLNCMGRQEAKKGAAVAAWSKQTGPAGREGRRWGY